MLELEVLEPVHLFFDERGELLFVAGGVGYHLSVGRDLNDMSQVVAIMLLIVGIGLIVDVLVFANLERLIRERWGLQKNGA